jgi:broad specificity phosphatase PhoE
MRGLRLCVLDRTGLADGGRILDSSPRGNLHLERGAAMMGRAAATPMQILYLIRHAETAFNRDGRIQGHSESMLSKLGIQQARRIGERLDYVHFVAAYTSPSKRTVHTARLALKGVEAQTRDGLREINLGRWEGMKASQLRERYPRLVEQWFHSPSAVRIPGAETVGQFRRRVVREMNRIRKEHPSGEVAVVTHGGVICVYLTSLLGMKLDDLWSFKIRNASVTRVLFPQGKARVDLLGDIHHLAGVFREVPGRPFRLFP